MEVASTGGVDYLFDAWVARVRKDRVLDAVDEGGVFGELSDVKVQFVLLPDNFAYWVGGVEVANGREGLMGLDVREREVLKRTERLDRL